MDISIIIPVYNAEKYLVRCLESIFNQRFSGTFEVIAVDDASTDNSLQLLRTYQHNESRLQIVALDSNKKQPIARSKGMDASKGNYIMHVDADDWLLPDALEILLQKCKKTNADVIVFNIIRKDNSGNTWPFNPIKKELITKNKLEVQKHFYGAICNKIVKREIAQDLISSEKGINSTEDLLYASEILFRADTIYLVPSNFYVYFMNIDSVTHTLGYEKYLNNQSIIMEQLEKIITRYNPNHELINNILAYLEKWILYMVCQFHFFYNKTFTNHETLINHFKLFPQKNNRQIYFLSMSMENKLFCFIYAMIKLGPRFAASVLWKSFAGLSTKTE
jgi:glycosyltransferase involved in cell wall biosynthesis